MALGVLVLFLSLYILGLLAENNSSAELLRLVGGASRCAGTVELKHEEEWRRGVPYDPFGLWDLGATATMCRDLNCGNAVYGGRRDGFPQSPVWWITPDCVKEQSVRECIRSKESPTSRGLEVKCSDSVRLVSGSDLCSGLVQIWEQSWTWVCEGALDLLSEEVLCMELGCGPPSLLDEARVPLGQQVFYCEGNESALMDCPHSSPGICSSEAIVILNCSEPVRLVGGPNHCAGTVEVKHRGEWRRVEPYGPLDLEAVAAVCQDLNCGSAVSGGGRHGFPPSPVWMISSHCVKTSSVRECIWSADSSSSHGLEVKCSGLLKKPIISLSMIDGASEALPQGVRVQLGSKFRVKCSVAYPGGSFQLLSPTVNLTLPAVNHSAHFLFSDTGSAHKGNYTCVYHLQVFNHTFSSQSLTLQLSLGVLDSHLIIRVLVILLLKLLYILPLYYHYCKARARGGARDRMEGNLD